MLRTCIIAQCALLTICRVIQAGVEVLDQSSVPANANYAYIVGKTGTTTALDVAQTFRTTQSGYFSRVELLIAHYSTTDDLIVDLRSCPSGVPQAANGAFMGSVTLPASAVPVNTFSFRQNPYWTSVDFSNQGIYLTANTLLAISLRSNNVAQPFLNYYTWFSSSQGENIYAQGSTWTRTGGSTNNWVAKTSPSGTTDQSFRQFVVIPESSSIVLIIVMTFPMIRQRKKTPRLSTQST